jgi:hypothetical protein
VCGLAFFRRVRLTGGADHERGSRARRPPVPPRSSPPMPRTRPGPEAPSNSVGAPPQAVIRTRRRPVMGGQWPPGQPEIRGQAQPRSDWSHSNEASRPRVARRPSNHRVLPLPPPTDSVSPVRHRIASRTCVNVSNLRVPKPIGTRTASPFTTGTEPRRQPPAHAHGPALAIQRRPPHARPRHPVTTHRSRPSARRTRADASSPSDQTVRRPGRVCRILRLGCGSSYSCMIV